jgi:hypothetical protein
MVIIYFLHEDKYYMRNKNNKITKQKVSSGTRRVNQVTNAVLSHE